MTLISTLSLRDRAATLADRPLASSPAEVWAVARAAERAGASTILVDILVDESAPDVVRRRALGRIGSYLERPSAGPVDGTPRHLGSTALSRISG